jgi:hypothetical protein
MARQESAVAQRLQTLGKEKRFVRPCRHSWTQCNASRGRRLQCDIVDPSARLDDVSPLSVPKVRLDVVTAPAASSLLSVSYGSLTS